MNSKIGCVGLLMAFPLFMIAIAPNHFDDAFAKSYNSTTDLCGDRLCNTLEYEAGKKEAKEEGAVVEIFDVDALVDDWYKVSVRIYSGNEDIPGTAVYVTSDISNNTVGVKSMHANSLEYVSILIQADDPSTIKAELVL